MDISNELSKDNFTSEIPFICLSSGEMFLIGKLNKKNYERNENYLKNFNSVIIKPFVKNELLYEIIKYLPFEMRDDKKPEIILNFQEKNKFNISDKRRKKIVFFKNDIRSVHNLPSLIKELNEQIEKHLSKITSGLSTVQEIDQFCDNLEIISKSYNYKILRKWSKEIKNLNSQFNMKAVLESIQDINVMLSILKEEKRYPNHGFFFQEVQNV